MNRATPTDARRAANILAWAQARLAADGGETATVVSAYSGATGRLVCIIDASGLDAVRQLFRTALLSLVGVEEIDDLDPAR